MKRTFPLKSILVSSMLAAVAFAGADDDRKFMEEAASGGLAEVKISQLAVGQSTTPSVKQLAQQMVDDHTKVNDELKGMCSKKSMPVPSEVLSNTAQKKYDELSKLPANKFEKEYLATLEDDHKKTIKLFEGQAKKGSDAELKQWAEKTLPALKHHLEMVQNVQKELKEKPAAKAM